MAKKDKKTPNEPVLNSDEQEQPAIPPTKTDQPTPDATPTVVRASDQKKKAKVKIPLWGWIVIGLVVLAAIAVGAYLAWSSSSPAATNSQASANQNTNAAPVLAPRVVDGVLVDETQTNPQLYAMMIENMTASRPPSGLDKASVVYEALAEGGITRFMAIIPATATAAELGPVRSARPYYIDWASEYNRPLYIHAGGSPQALAQLRSGSSNVIDYNQFSHGGFWRDKKRAAPHNLYTGTSQLSAAVVKLKLTTPPSFTSWLYAAEPALDLRPMTVKDIVVDFSSFSYRVSYVYDRGQNQYVRSVGGQPHVTRDGVQLTAKNIIVEFIPTSLYPKEKQRLKLQTVGQGKALVFRNGETIVGTWKKASINGRTEFLDASGQPIALSPGTTWVEAIPTNRTVTY